MKLLPNLNLISSRLILLSTGILLLGLLVLFLLLSSYLRQDLAELISAQLVTIANYVAGGVDQDLVERRDMLSHVAAQFPAAPPLEEQALRVWLGERHEINPLFSQGLMILDAAGIAVADYPLVPGRAGLSFSDRDYFQSAMRGEFFIGSPVFGRASKIPVLPMAMPLRDRAGAVRAVLVGIAALKSTNFIEELYTTLIGSTGGLVLVSPRDRLFIASSSDPAITLMPTPRTGVHPQHDQAMRGFRGVGIDVNAAGIEELAAIASVSSSGWFVVAHVPTRELFAPIARLRRFMLTISIVLVPVFMLIMGFGLRQQLRSLRKAAQHAERMMCDERSLAPFPVSRHDEVGQLTAAFNRVLEKLLESRARMEHLAHHDALTGLPNRQLLAVHLRHALARARRHQRHLALLFLDLDGFKSINDRLGHGAGDQALREVADRLSRVVRHEDTVARVGGDEFVILLADLDDQARTVAEFVADKCLSAFQPPFEIDGQPCGLGTSIGIVIDQGERTPNQLLTVADQAMYRAKAARHGHVCWAEQ